MNETHVLAALKRIEEKLQETRWQEEARTQMIRARGAEDLVRYSVKKLDEIGQASAAKPERLREIADGALAHIKEAQRRSPPSPED